MQEDGSRRAIAAAFSANLAIAIAKLAAFLVTGAASLLAEAVHSLADTTNQGLLILGIARAKQEATPEHPFGFGRERYFWAFVVAMVLFSLGSVFASTRASTNSAILAKSYRRRLRSASSYWRSHSRAGRFAPPSSQRIPFAATRAGGPSFAARRARSFPSSCSKISAPYSAS